MYKIILISISILTLFSCKTEHYFLGEYSNGHSYLKLDSNNTFVYKKQLGSIKEISEGTWEHKSKNIYFLNSFLNDLDSFTLSIIENSDCTKNQFVFKNFFKKSKWIRWSIVINNEATYTIESDTILIPKQISIIMFYIKGELNSENLVPVPLRSSVKSKVYYIKDMNSNITIEFLKNFDSEFLDIFFYRPINSTIKVRGPILKMDHLKLRKITR